MAKQAYLSATSNRRGGSGPADSFVLLNNSTVLPSRQGTTTPDKPTKRALSTQLLQLVSSRTDTDHPLCSECAKLLQEVLAEKLGEVALERDAYIAFERQVKSRPDGGRKSEGEMQELEAKLEKVRWRFDLVMQSKQEWLSETT